MSDLVNQHDAHVRVSTMVSLATGFVSWIRGRVRTRLSVYIRTAVCGGTLGHPYLRENTNQDVGKLLGIESEGGSSERITTWVLWTVEKFSDSWNSWTSLCFSFWNLNIAQAFDTELRAYQYCSVECSILHCIILEYCGAEFQPFFIPRSQPCLSFYLPFC